MEEWEMEDWKMHKRLTRVTNEELNKAIIDFTAGYRRLFTLTEKVEGVNTIVKTSEYENEYNYILVETYKYTDSNLVSAIFYKIY